MAEKEEALELLLHGIQTMEISSKTSTATTTSTSTTRWSEIQPDLLELILKKLGFVDISRSKCVSSSWRSITKSYFFSRRYTASQTPWLMVPSDDMNSFCFFSLADQKNKDCYNIFQIKNKDKKTISPKYSYDDIVGSSHGWLVIWNSMQNTQLLYNPLCKCKIQLPLLSIQIPSPIDASNVIISCDPSPHKNNNYIVVGLYGGRVAFYRRGDETWSLLSEYHDYDNIVFYNGDLLAMRPHSIEVWEFKENTFPINTKNLDIPFVSSSPVCYYLVESPDDLLLLILNLDYEFLYYGKPYQSTQKIIVIYKFDFEAKEWERVEGLPGGALFLDARSAKSLTTHGFPDLEENSIYFTGNTGGRWRRGRGRLSAELFFGNH